MDTTPLIPIKGKREIRVERKRHCLKQNMDSVFITYNCISDEKENSGGNSMSLTTELEDLAKEKAQLTQMLQSLEEEEKYLGNRLRIVHEKIEIRVLRQKVNAKRAAVVQLKSKIKELEGRLNQPQQKEPMKVVVKEASADSQKPR